MLYDLNNPIDNQKAQSRFKELLEKPCIIELKKKQKRSLNQNNYLHLLLTWFGMELGYTLEESKQLYKRVCKEIYFYDNKGTPFIRSSADLDTAEMTKSIAIFRDYSSMKANVYLPEPGDEAFLREIELQASRNHYV